MERLTDACWKNLDPWECCGQDYYCKRGCHDKGGCTNGCIVPKLYVRLAAYEDTGLTPEEIKAPFTEDAAINLASQALGVEADRLRELAEADKDGRVIVLPAKKGDTWKKAMSILDKKYAEAKKLQFVRDPLAWALYHTWREFDDGKRCD